MKYQKKGKSSMLANRQSNFTLKRVFRSFLEKKFSVAKEKPTSFMVVPAHNSSFGWKR
jgi:hypothetical protein